MKIDINCTIIFQMINFIIAYCIIRWTFKPLVRIIKSYRDEHDYLEKGVAGLKQDLVCAAEMHEAKWQEFSGVIGDQSVHIHNLKYKVRPHLNVPWQSITEQPMQDQTITQVTETVVHAFLKDVHGR